MKHFMALAEVKSLDDATDPNGEFEVILSACTVDRDGEVIDARAFEPLPESIPFHAFHDFHDPVGRAVPFYDGDVLKARGRYASTPRAQEIRTLVAEGVIGHTSVGFMGATRSDMDGVPHITKGELLEGSFVSVPSNREAAVLVAKAYQRLADTDGAAHLTAPGPDGSTSAPATPDGKSPASTVVEVTLIRARAALLAVGQ